jgi:hypothetical protein
MPTGALAARAEAGPQSLGASIFATAKRREVSGPGLRTFITLANLWGLTEEQRRRILGSPARSTYQNWVKTVQEHRDLTLDYDVLIRISAVLGIYQALRILYDTEEQGIEWLRGPHKARIFGGKAPLDLITSGPQDAILTTRRFLDAARGGLYMEPNQLDQDFVPYTDADLVWS